MKCLTLKFLSRHSHSKKEAFPTKIAAFIYINVNTDKKNNLCIYPTFRKIHFFARPVRILKILPNITEYPNCKHDEVLAMKTELNVYLILSQ